MVKPLAPVVHGPILPTSASVLVSGALGGAEVVLLVAGDRVGTAVAAVSGQLWVGLDRRLAPGAAVTARQAIGGAASPPSNQPVTVIDVPIPLPPPAFGSPVTECMDHVLLSSLVPGAKVTLKVGSTVLATFDAVGTSAWASFDPSPLDAGQTLAAVQAVDAQTSTVAFSLPLASVSQREGLPVPVIAGPLHACETAVLVAAMIPAGQLELENRGSAQAWVNIAEAYWATGVRPLQEGSLKARQRLPGCGGVSADVDVPVGPAVTPPAPVLQPFCPDARRVVVSGLKPGGVLTLWSKVWDQPAESEIGSIGIGAASEQVDLPEQIGGSGDIMAIVARQTLCGLTSPPGASLEFARPGSGALPPPTPAIVAPLLDCMRAVPATNLLNGVLTQVFSEATGQPLSDMIVATSPTVRLPLWLPLVEGDKVAVRQQGCSAPSRTAVERVQPLPSPLPPPRIATPVRPGDRAVRVEKCLPGSRVHLLVDWVERAQSDQTWTGEATLQLPTALAEGHKLWAVQVMCAQRSDLEGPPVIVAKGRLDLAVTPDSAPGGKATSFVVQARDQDTGKPVPGLPVVLGGVPVGVTGASFAWTPPTSGTSATGLVQGGVAYGNAGFTIAIRQAVPLTLTLFPGPVVEPNKVWHTDVVWTATPRWGAAAVGINANTGTAMVPPPPAGENRVSVTLAFKVHLQGEIGGIIWQPEVIEISGYLADVALTGLSHALSARFWYQATDVPIVDENGQVTGWESRLAAGAQLFSIT
jgi:hypothetical protein